MKSISLFIGTLVFYLFLVGFVNAQTERQYTYQVLNVQLPSGTIKFDLVDLNTDRGEIVGTGSDAAHRSFGLIVNRHTMEARRFYCDGPESATRVMVMHNLGSIAGECVSNAYGPPEGRVSRGFIFRPQAGNEMIYFRPQQTTGPVTITGLADDGACVLTYSVMDGTNGPNTSHAAYCNGGWPEILVPIDPALGVVVEPTGRDTQGRIAGWFFTRVPEISWATGFLLDNGQATFINFPGGDSTALLDLAKTEILFQYGGSLNMAKTGGLPVPTVPQRGVYEIATGRFYTLSLPTPSPGTTLGGISANGLNDNGEIVGRYSEVSGVVPYTTSRTVWFIATPVPETPLAVARAKKPKRNR